MRSAMLLALLLVAAPLTGCLANGDDDTDPTLPNGDNSEPTTNWRTTTHSGTVEGVGTPGPSIAGGDNTASWSVSANAFTLQLDLASEGTLGDDLTFQYGPNCETEPTVTCDYSGETEDGQASITIDDPAPGTWEIFFFLDTNAGEVEWVLETTIGERT